jgi:thiamine phosphate synthase YjbQ (UPF0047 family)
MISHHSFQLTTSARPEFFDVTVHPGPIHIANATRLRNEKPEWGLNTDGHIISSILGRSETIPVVDKQLGEFGRIYFADLDSVRERTRIVRITIRGE